MAMRESTSSMSFSISHLNIQEESIGHLSDLHGSEHEEEENHGNCFISFWGPYRPLFGGHSDVEAATSVFLSPVVLLIMRMLVTLTLLTIFLFYSVDNQYPFRFFSIHSHLLLMISFMLSAMMTLTYMMTKGPGEGAKQSILACVVVPFYQTAATLQLFSTITISCMGFLGEFGFNAIFQHIIALLFILTDMLLTLRIQFRLFYIIFSLMYVISFIIFLCIRSKVMNDLVYPLLTENRKNAGKLAGIYIFTIVISFLSGLTMIALSRLSRLSCCGPEIVADKNYGWHIFDESPHTMMMSDAADKTTTVV